MALSLHSPTIRANDAIPAEHTCDGADRSPALAWSGAPAETQAFAVIVHDPDAPRGDWVHWVLFDVPGDARELDAGLSSAPILPTGERQGVNDFGRIGWGGPCPPPGAPHRYVFELFALDAPLGLAPGIKRAALVRAMHGHVVAEARFVAHYARKR